MEAASIILLLILIHLLSISALVLITISLAILVLLGRPETGKMLERRKLLIPTTVLYEAFSRLIKPGRHGKEWILLLGAQEMDGNLIVTHIYDPGCVHSSGVSAEGNPDGIFRAYDFYRLCGGKIVGLVHIHPWESDSVSPSCTDMEYQRKWERIYRGEFIGIVFNNSGIFRIFTAGRSRVSPEMLGRGVSRIGRDVYVLDEKDFL